MADLCVFIVLYSNSDANISEGKSNTFLGWLLKESVWFQWIQLIYFVQADSLLIDNLFFEHLRYGHSPFIYSFRRYILSDTSYASSLSDEFWLEDEFSLLDWVKRLDDLVRELDFQ